MQSTIKEKIAQIDSAAKITKEFIKRMESLGDKKLRELQELNDNLTLLDDFRKMKNKKEYLKHLAERKKKIKEENDGV